MDQAFWKVLMNKMLSLWLHDSLETIQSTTNQKQVKTEPRLNNWSVMKVIIACSLSGFPGADQFNVFFLLGLMIKTTLRHHMHFGDSWMSLGSNGIPKPCISLIWSHFVLSTCSFPSNPCGAAGRWL